MCVISRMLLQVLFSLQPNEPSPSQIMLIYPQFRNTIGQGISITTQLHCLVVFD